MTKFKVGDIVKMKTCNKISSKDDLWEVTATEYPMVKWPLLLIRNVADYCNHPDVVSYEFDESLLKKVL